MLWSHCGHDPDKMAESLTKLALQGISGHLGGQDNIALVLLKRPAWPFQAGPLPL